MSNQPPAKQVNNNYDLFSHDFTVFTQLIINFCTPSVNVSNTHTHTHIDKLVM